MINESNTIELIMQCRLPGELHYLLQYYDLWGKQHTRWVFVANTDTY